MQEIGGGSVRPPVKGHHPFPAWLVADDHGTSAVAKAYLAQMGKSGVWSKPIVTGIESYKAFYPAEAYHQRYFENNGSKNGYCVAVVGPKLAKFRKTYAARLKR